MGPSSKHFKIFAPFWYEIWQYSKVLAERDRIVFLGSRLTVPKDEEKFTLCALKIKSILFLKIH